MKFRCHHICGVLAIVGISCSARLPSIIQDMRSATRREEQVRIFNRIATNAQERSDLFAYMDARPDSFAAAKSKLLTFYADQTNKTAQRPTPLDLSSISSPYQTCEGLNYTFYSPWPEFVVSDGSENQWVAFQDKHGRMMMMSRSTTTNAFDDFVLRELSSATNDSNWIQALAFPDRTNNQGIDYYRQCLGIAPSDLNACVKIEDAFQYLARMTIKLILLSGNASPIINEVKTGAYGMNTGIDYGRSINEQVGSVNTNRIAFNGDYSTKSILFRLEHVGKVKQNDIASANLNRLIIGNYLRSNGDCW